MKKLYFLLAAASLTLCASAQLKVTESGQVRLGSLTEDSNKANSDTTSNLRIGGIGPNFSGGRLSFGTGLNFIEHPIQSSSSKGTLNFYTGTGFSFISGGSTVLDYSTSYSISGTGNTLKSNVPVSAPKYLTTSDARAKTDIQPLGNMGNYLGEIVPISYILSYNTQENDSANDGRQKSKTSSMQHQYGFLAQDVREVYPDLVYEDSEGMLSIDYTGFIAILVDAVQNLQGQVREQAEMIETLRNGSKEDTPVENDAVVASLSQNRPNPFRTSTVVSCVLPDDVSSAFLCVYDLNGNQKLRNNITERGNVDITIEGNTLTAGMYIYTLIADGVEIDSKRMILTD